MEDAEGSTKWRKKIRELFFNEYFSKAPLLGQGYHFDPSLAKQETDIYLAIVRRQAAAGDEYANERNYIEMRQPHEGPVHILLVTGVVGAFFFVFFCASMLLYAFGSAWRTPAKQLVPIQTWAAALLLPQIFGFYLVFGDLTFFLQQVCPIIALLYRHERLKEILRDLPLPSPGEGPSDPSTIPPSPRQLFTSSPAQARALRTPTSCPAKLPEVKEP